MPVKFKKAGVYKIKAVPYLKQFGAPSACTDAEKTVYVGMYNVGSISGLTSIGCGINSNLTYSIPPVANADRYVWSASSALNFVGGTPSNGGASITYTANAVSGATSGTSVSVTIYSKCAGEPPVTRTLAVSRVVRVGSITRGLPSVVCRGNRYGLSADGGSNYRWTISYYGTSGLISTETYMGATIAIVIPNDTRIQSVRYLLDYNNVCNGQAAQLGNYSNVSSSNCTPGARRSAEPEEPVAGVYPNPVSDLLQISIPEAAADGGFTIQLHDAQARLVRQKTTASGLLQVDVRQLPTGLYLLRTVRASGASTIQKVQVIH